jgi:hypothetical protein
MRVSWDVLDEEGKATRRVKGRFLTAGCGVNSLSVGPPAVWWFALVVEDGQTVPVTVDVRSRALEVESE